MTLATCRRPVAACVCDSDWPSNGAAGCRLLVAKGCRPGCLSPVDNRPASKQASALLSTGRPTSITGYPLDGAPADRATITFNTDGHWTGSDGCNALGGKFKATATKISTYLSPQTAIGCNNVPNTTVLERAAHWKATSTTLALYNMTSAPLAT